MPAEEEGDVDRSRSAGEVVLDSDDDECGDASRLYDANDDLCVASRAGGMSMGDDGMRVGDDDNDGMNTERRGVNGENRGAGNEKGVGEGGVDESVVECIGEWWTTV